jgi:hypothetical protein
MKNTPNNSDPKTTEHYEVVGTDGNYKVYRVTRTEIQTSVGFACAPFLVDLQSQVDQWTVRDLLAALASLNPRRKVLFTSEFKPRSRGTVLVLVTPPEPVEVRKLRAQLQLVGNPETRLVWYAPETDTHSYWRVLGLDTQQNPVSLIHAGMGRPRLGGSDASS